MLCLGLEFGLGSESVVYVRACETCAEIFVKCADVRVHMFNLAVGRKNQIPKISATQRSHLEVQGISS